MYRKKYKNDGLKPLLCVDTNKSGEAPPSDQSQNYIPSPGSCRDESKRGVKVALSSLYQSKLMVNRS